MFDKLESLRQRMTEINEELSQPEVMLDYSRCQALLREMSSLQPVVREYDAYRDLQKRIRDTEEMLHDPELASVAEAEIRELTSLLEQKLNGLKLMLVPSDPLDSKNVILEIRAGVGGEEAALFAADLLRMYMKFADKASLNVSVLSVSETDLRGINEALLLITGAEPYGLLKYESGIHCVKRVPVTESGGRIHTSTATVAVLPEADEKDLTINPSDIRIDVFHASGHGGQGVNTTDSAVRVTHLPTGTVVTCQDERSQLENKNKALKVLRSRLLDQLRAEQEAATASDRSLQVGHGARSEKIRTYYFNHDYVVDHRIGMTVNRTAVFLNGEIMPLIEALRLAEKTDRLSILSRGV